MMDREFRRALDACLGRLSRGDDARACLADYPAYASRLEPYVQAASTIKGMNVPRPSAGARQKARRKLLDAVAGTGPVTPDAGPAWLPAPLLRAGTVAAALVMFLIAAIGASAALGGGDAVHDVLSALRLPSPIGGAAVDEDPDVLEFSGRVVSVGQFGLVLRTDDGFPRFRYVADTEVEDRHGEPVSRDDVTRGLDVFVQAVEGDLSGWLDALLVRLRDNPASPTPTPAPTPKPTPTPTPEPTPPPIVWTEVSYEGKIASVSPGSFVLKVDGIGLTFFTDGETQVSGLLEADGFAKVSALKSSEGTLLARQVTTHPPEFWATVVSVSNSTVTVKVEGAGGNVTLRKNAETEVIGPIFAGVMVWVKAYKNADGSYRAVKIAVKTTSFSGKVTAIDGSTYTLTKKGESYTVTTNGETQFIGTTSVGSAVTVHAYRMADGTYLAYKVAVDSVSQDVFTGVITRKNLAIDTIWVKVGGEEIEVRIEFATIIGTLKVGATVVVYVDKVAGGTYFASKVKVTG